MLIYRVNRRPPPEGPTLFHQPGSVLHHLRTVLDRSMTSLRYGRAWRIGNKSFDTEGGTFSGIIGWARSNEILEQVWDPETDSWTDRVTLSDSSAAAPFVFLEDGRYLGILRHRSFREKNLARVFSDLLNRGEHLREVPTTEWDVEPVGDTEQFFDWLDKTDRVYFVDFVFKRPNPDAEEAFSELFARMDALEARQIRETITAASEAHGLNKESLRSGHTSRAFIAAAMAAYGYLVGHGYAGGKKTKYDQRQRVAREAANDVGAAWESATQDVLRAVRRARWRRNG